MRKLAMIPCLILGVAATALANGPADVRLGSPTIGGNGCVDLQTGQPTARSVLSPDNTSLSIIYDTYSARAGRNARQTFDRKACNFIVPLQVPAGYQVSVMQVDYRGFSAIPMGGAGRFRAEFFFAGQAPGIITEQSFAPGAMTEFLVPHNMTVESWSSCGAAVNLRVNSSIIAQSNANGDDAQVMVDSTDVNVQNKFGVIFHLNFRPCGGSQPMPPVPGPQPLPPGPQPLPPGPQPMPPMPQPQPQPIPPMPGVFNADTMIEGHRYLFRGNSDAEIYQQCVNALNMDPSLNRAAIDDVVVNGVTRHNGPAYWNVSETCSIVAEIATQVFNPGPQPQPQPMPQPMPPVYGNAWYEAECHADDDGSFDYGQFVMGQVRGASGPQLMEECRRLATLQNSRLVTFGIKNMRVLNAPAQFVLAECDIDDDSSFDFGQVIVGQIAAPDFVTALRECKQVAQMTYSSSSAGIRNPAYNSAPWGVSADCHIDDDSSFDYDQFVFGRIYAPSLEYVAAQCRDLAYEIYGQSGTSGLRNVRQ